MGSVTRGASCSPCRNVSSRSRSRSRTTRRSHSSAKPHHEPKEEGAIPMRQLVVVATILLAIACGGPQSSPPPAAEPSTAVQLGGPPTGAGTTTADTGEIQPADPTKFYKTPCYSPHPGRNYPERPYFGDEHVHTAWSVDAGGTGTTLGPEEATRFARGEEVV